VAAVGFDIAFDGLITSDAPFRKEHKVINRGEEQYLNLYKSGEATCVANEKMQYNIQPVRANPSSKDFN
jgi:hypothetical protein